MSTKGFAPIILIIIFAAVILTGGSFYLYSQQNKPKTAEVVEQNSSQVEPENVSPTPKPSANSYGIPIQVTQTLSTAKPTISPASQTNQPPPPAPEIIINAAGSFAYSGQEIKYAISFPKNGGNVTGNISGICSGPITGNFSGGDGGLIKSSVDANCQLGLLSQDLKADFEGKVFFAQGRADLEWQGSIPFYSGSKQFSLAFTPL